MEFAGSCAFRCMRSTLDLCFHHSTAAQPIYVPYYIDLQPLAGCRFYLLRFEALHARKVSALMLVGSDGDISSCLRWICGTCEMLVNPHSLRIQQNRMRDERYNKSIEYNEQNWWKKNEINEHWLHGLLLFDKDECINKELTEN